MLHCWYEADHQSGQPRGGDSYLPHPRLSGTDGAARDGRRSPAQRTHRPEADKKYARCGFGWLKFEEQLERESALRMRGRVLFVALSLASHGLLTACGKRRLLS